MQIQGLAIALDTLRSWREVICSDGAWCPGWAGDNDKRVLLALVSEIGTTAEHVAYMLRTRGEDTQDGNDDTQMGNDTAD